DAQATTVFVSQDLYPQIQPLLGQGLSHAITATYSEYIAADTDLRVPAFVSEPRRNFSDEGNVAWADALAANLTPGPITVGPDDMAVMPYTSGTTGHPKGCVHTHHSVMYNAISRHVWLGSDDNTVLLGALPWFHV